MSQYKVGDVAALFSKPKEPTTESGKKLQALFKQFQSKNRKDSQIIEKAVNNFREEWEKAQNQRVSKKGKKRKFSAVTSEETDEVNNNTKKFKQAKNEAINSTELKGKHFPAEINNNTKKFKKVKNEATNSTELKGKHFAAQLNNNTKKFKKVKNEATNSTELKGKHFEAQLNNNGKKFKKAKNKAINSTELKGKHFEAQLNNNAKKFKKAKNEAINSTELKGKHSPNEVNNNTKKFKEVENEATNSTEIKGKHFSAELDFPRKKKSKANKDNLKNNTFNSFAEDQDDSKRAPNADFKSKLKSNDKKQISKFIRMSKQQRQAAINGDIKSKDNKVVSDKDKYGNGTLFKEENEEFVEQSAKKHKKKKHSNDTFVQNKISSDTGRNENKTLFKKSYGANKQNSQPTISEKGEPDFIKLPDLKSEEDAEELSRTLFVANLPLTLNKKVLTTLFSPFGEVENVRYSGFETDKAKIFNKNGPRTLNPQNYAADSIPAFIVFRDRESAVKALSLSGSLFQGRHITVDFAVAPGTHKMYDDKRSIFIGNLPFGCQDESIWEAFSECGRIESVRIVRDKETGIGKGFGYVLFSTVQSKENALGLEDLEIQGRTIRIKEVNSNPSKQKKGNIVRPAKIDTFKSRAIKIKKRNEDSTSRKSTKKIIKKQKNIRNKKKIANILQKSMKF